MWCGLDVVGKRAAGACRQGRIGLPSLVVVSAMFGSWVGDDGIHRKAVVSSRVTELASCVPRGYLDPMVWVSIVVSSLFIHYLSRMAGRNLISILRATSITS